jgi:hypothetical protein
MANSPIVGAETAAQRYARDVAARGGDVQVTYNGAGDPVFSLVAATAVGGRTNRDFLQRGGDVYYTYDVNGAPIRNVDVNGRNERQYVNYATGDSAIQGAGKSDLYDALKARSSGA